MYRAHQFGRLSVITIDEIKWSSPLFTALVRLRVPFVDNHVWQLFLIDSSTTRSRISFITWYTWDMAPIPTSTGNITQMETKYVHYKALYLTTCIGKIMYDNTPHIHLIGVNKERRCSFPPSFSLLSIFYFDQLSFSTFDEEGYMYVFVWNFSVWWLFRFLFNLLFVFIMSKESVKLFKKTLY